MALQQEKNVLLFSIIIVFTLIVVRLFNIQIISKYYRINAENNALKYETLYPARDSFWTVMERFLFQTKLPMTLW